MDKKCYKIRKQANLLSKALTEKGVMNKIQTIYARKHAIIWVPYAQVKLKINEGNYLEDPNQLFQELPGSRIIGDFSKTVLVSNKKIDDDINELTDLLVKYMIKRYELLLLIPNANDILSDKPHL